jgi:nanoRNase/pAp phosphatase (c-di-AMP/oligoRNAs hydrolase)
MKKNLSSQFSKLILKSSHILIILPENPNYDVLSSGLGLAEFCHQKNLNISLVYLDPQENKQSLDFLNIANSTKIIHSIAGSRDLILTFNTKYNNILQARTERTENEFRVYITPEKGMVDSRDFSFLPAKFPYDLIITLGMPERESAGKIYEEAPDLFYEVPIINIDNQNQNNQFGQVNIIEITASSIAEIIAQLLKDFDEKNISQNCANYLLTGIITATHSFQKKNTTPSSMNLASYLIEKGADQQKIVQHLYKTQPLSLIKLWGKAMSNLNKDEKNNLIWTILNQKEIADTGAKYNELYLVLEKIKQNYSAGKIYIIIYEDEVKNYIALIDAEKIGGLAEEKFGKPISTGIYKIGLKTKTKKQAYKILSEKIDFEMK